VDLDQRPLRRDAMKLSDFDYALPPELIAQAPLPERDASRLLHLPREGALRHLAFSALSELLQPGDLLVLNDTRTIPARLRGKKRGTGGQAELLLVRPWATVAAVAMDARVEGQEWLCIGQASKGLKAGQVIELGPDASAEIVEPLQNGEYRVRLHGEAATLRGWTEQHGALPLPPYIDRAPVAADQERYQTVFAKVEGSVAAPTAGLHFTPRVLEALQARGVQRAFVTLDVGPGTFLPVREENLDLHRMHAERCTVPAATAEAIARVRREGKRVVAVGTTVVRTLEAFAKDDGTVPPSEGETALFIRPGFKFRVVDALLTNFHLPRSTLLMLVSAFAGKERVLAAYGEAVAQRYRFFSYGDAMFLERP
jgi:S-adenosylmethionine:tRNA ribosyltransferase-isomerase